MTESTRISDEMLNAFVDNELSDNDTIQIYLAMSKDKSLRDKVCELRSNQELLRAAYRSVPASRSTERLPSGTVPRLSLAAAIISLGVGALLGWYAHPVFQPSAPAVLADAETRSTSKVRVVFHVSRNDVAAFEQILEEAETLLRTGSGSTRNSSVRIVANGEGLYLLGAETSPLKERIRTLNKNYDNLVFAGCAQTQRRIQLERGRNIELLPQVTMVDSGVLEVLRLQEDGWNYIPI